MASSLTDLAPQRSLPSFLFSTRCLIFHGPLHVGWSSDSMAVLGSAASYYTWRLTSRRKWKLLGQLKATLKTGTVSLWLYSIVESSHRACPDAWLWSDGLCLFTGEWQNHISEELWDGRYYYSYLWKMQYVTFGVSGMESSRSTLCPYFSNAARNGVSFLSLPFPRPISFPEKCIEFPQRDSPSASHIIKLR